MYNQSRNKKHEQTGESSWQLRQGGKIRVRHWERGVLGSRLSWIVLGWEGRQITKLSKRSVGLQDVQSAET